MKRRRNQRELRWSQPTLSYVETSSEDEFDDIASEDEHRPSQTGRRQSTTRRRKQGTDSRTSIRPRQKQSRVRQSSPHLTSSKAPTAAIKMSAIQQTRIPPWQTLPYQILLDIFTFASYPLCDEVGEKPQPSVTWLLDSALVCKDFTEPVLTVLYTSPPLSSLRQAQAFLNVLQTGDKNTLNYNTKVRRLTIPLALVSPQKHSFDLAALTRQTPLLSSLEVVLNIAGPRYLFLSREPCWNYPTDLILALEETGIRLRHWKWNMGMAEKDIRPADLERILMSAPFQSLQTLELGNMNAHPYVPGGDDVELRGFAAAIQRLKYIRCLSLERCINIQGIFLSLLPPTLERLELTGCPTVNSEMLHDYLVVSGRSLTELSLNYNESLDISFLPDLEACCPRLRALRVNMQFHYSESSYITSNPHSDRLLAPEEVPTWPSTLQSIELLQVRKRDQDAAEGFFQSLLDSASTLVHLRKLSLYIVLSIPFRERATFRTEWIRKLEAAYLRHPDLPNPHLMSIDLWKSWKAQQASVERHLRDGPVLEFPSRQQEHTSPNQTPPTRSRRSTRVPQAKARSEESTSNEREDDSKNDPPKQGLCNVVDIRIDNSKQREEKFTERDFLDEEPSGDDDWDESIDGMEESGYAW